MLSWMLLACVVAGLYRRRAFFASMLRRRFRSRWTDLGVGVAIYVSFLTSFSFFIIVAASILTAREHRKHAAVRPDATKTRSGDSATQTPNAERMKEEAQTAQRRLQRTLRFDQRTVISIAPSTLPELLMWLGLSLTAGFCEEHIFRGYLLRQSLAALRRFSMPSWLASTLSVIATSALFGSLHLYEGFGGAVVVAVLGAVLAVMTLVLGNLRAVIVAHALQDFVGGLSLYLFHLKHVS